MKKNTLEAAQKFQAALAEFGSVTAPSGLAVAMTQNAYMDNHGTDGGVRYYANGVDVFGNSNACEWDNPASVVMTDTFDSDDDISDCDGMEIEYYAYSGNMGDTSEDSCQKFRDWARNEIKAAYPSATVRVLNQDNLNGAWTSNEALREEIADFCHRLWDRCPWNWTN